MSSDVMKLVTCCTSREVELWKFTQQKILNYIDAELYEVIIPDSDYQIFLDNTDSKFLITKESLYINNELRSILSSVITQKKLNFNWYLQQLLKIEATKHFVRPDDTVLIWDSDTLPLRPLRFTNYDKTLLYYLSNENHSPYFKTLESLTGLTKSIDKSFISQNIPIRSVWATNFCKLIEQQTNQNWMIAIAGTLRGLHGSEFSEYESLGTYATVHHSKIMQPNRSPFAWIRHGCSVLGTDYSKIENFQLESLSIYYDYVSFERWDTDRYEGVNLGCGDSRIERTFFGGRMMNVDLHSTSKTDLVVNLNLTPWYFGSSSFKHVVINSVLEHLDDVISAFSEIDRILMPGGLLQFEVPFIGSYNHGTDITHKRGFTFDSFQFLYDDFAKLSQVGSKHFNYKLLQFWIEDENDGRIVRTAKELPSRHQSLDWTVKVSTHQVPGTFGYVLQKLS